MQQLLRHDRRPMPAGQLAFGNIETPAGGPTGFTAERDIPISLSGWVVFNLPDDPVQELDILLDGTQKATVKHFSARPDVADAYGRPDFESCGWLAIIYLSGTTPGRHVLLLHATSQSGKSSDLPPLILNVQ